MLELKPPAANVPFWQGLENRWPGFASFLLSFLFIGIMWINHHRLFTRVKRVDEYLLLTNLLLLLGVVWIPFPTALMAQDLTNGSLRDAAVLYNGSYLAIALLFNLLLYTCIRRQLVDPEYAALRNIARAFAVGPAMYILCFALTWWFARLSLVLNGAIALYFLLSPEHIAKHHAASPR